MDPWIWIRMAPLAAAGAWTAWNLVRERELRLALPIALLGALALRHGIAPPPRFEDPLQWLTDPQASAVVMGIVTDLLGIALAFFSCRDLKERNRAEQVQWDTMESLRRLTLAFQEGDTLDARLRAVLACGRAELAMELGAFTARRRDGCEVEAVDAEGEPPFAPGDRLDVEATFAEATSAADVLLIESTARRPWSRHPAREIHGIESYAGITLRTEGEVRGTLFFASRTARRRRFTGVERSLLQLMGQWVSAALERSPDHAERQKLVPRRGDEIAPRRLDLQWAVERLVDELRERPEGRIGIDLTANDASLDLPLYRYEFDRVMESLVAHAAEMGPDGPLQIESRPVSAPASEPDGPAARYAQLEVCARGVTLDSKALDRLFESQAPPATARPDGSRLLALRHVEHALRRAGGDLSVHSEREHGTTFTAFFPAGDRP